MEVKENIWLQTFVDAMTEKDPYKRLALVRKLRRIPKQTLANETFDARTGEATSKLKARARN